jgi:hypothetical protein
LFHWCSLLLLCVQGIQCSITQHFKRIQINTSQQTLKESDIEEDYWFSFSWCYKLSSRHLLDGISCNVGFIYPDISPCFSRVQWSKNSILALGKC